MQQEGSAKQIHRINQLPGGATSEFWFQIQEGRVSFCSLHSGPGGGGSGWGRGWVKCKSDSCIGEAVAQGACLQHASSADRVKYFEEVRKLSETSPRDACLSLRGIETSQALWDEIVNSAAFADGSPVARVSFHGSKITARIDLCGVKFLYALDFNCAEVVNRVSLRDSEFSGGFGAQRCAFDNEFLDCNGSTFSGDVHLSDSCSKSGGFDFRGATFRDHVIADRLIGRLMFPRATFERNLSCCYSRVEVFDLSEAKLKGDLSTTGSEMTSFAGNQLVAEVLDRIGPLNAKTINLSRSTFNSRVHLNAVADRTDLTGAAFKEGGLVDIDGEVISMVRLTTGKPLRIAGKPGASRQPEIVTLANTDTGKLSLSRIDLTRCSFAGAHGLAEMELDTTVTFAKRKSWFGERRFLVDELAWRVSSGGRQASSWSIPEVEVSATPPSPLRPYASVVVPPISSAEVAGIYRGLRRSLEGKSDMAGAADFYYGEMEMRKWSASLPERCLLWTYWAVSGYGLRAIRAFAAWIILIFAAATLMTFFGFNLSNTAVTPPGSTLQPPSSPPPQPIIAAGGTTMPVVVSTPVTSAIPAVSPGITSSRQEFTFERAILFSLRASLPGVATLDQASLTAIGQWIETALRIFGPITVAMFFIALRTRLMRKPSD